MDLDKVLWLSKHERGRKFASLLKQMMRRERMSGEKEVDRKQEGKERKEKWRKEPEQVYKQIYLLKNFPFLLVFSFSSLIHFSRWFNPLLADCFFWSLQFRFIREKTFDRTKETRNRTFFFFLFRFFFFFLFSSSSSFRFPWDESLPLEVNVTEILKKGMSSFTQSTSLSSFSSFVSSTFSLPSFLPLFSLSWVKKFFRRCKIRKCDFLFFVLDSRGEK